VFKPDLADPGDFAKVYQRHRGRAFAAAQGVLGDPAAAEDVVQEVFLRIWSRPRMFDATRGSLETFIAMTARSRAIDLLRSRARRDAVVARAAEDARLPEEDHDAVSEQAIRSELRASTLRAVAQLPPAQREAVLLNYAGGLTVPEIAERTGVPLGTAKSRVRLALRHARAVLDAAA
jgi:RNA polymerase sigma-70 factor (ECF subfamily)